MDKNHPPVNYGKTGVLIINLGTPDSTNWFDIRKYLKEFLSDRRVIEVNPIIWQIILNLFIDIPLTILLLTHLLLTLIYYFRFHTRESSINYLTALIILNYILITALYLTLWKNMELETPLVRVFRT